MRLGELFREDGEELGRRGGTRKVVRKVGVEQCYRWGALVEERQERSAKRRVLNAAAFLKRVTRAFEKSVGSVRKDCQP